MATRYKGSIMSATAANSTALVASGIWRSNEVMQAISAYAWPGNSPPSTVQFLLVAGGGAGGNNFSGGGGAGGLITGPTQSVSAGTSYTVTIGAGASAPTSISGPYAAGSNSVFSVVTGSPAVGGGGGGCNGYLSFVGGPGGSGGGAGYTSGTAGGTATAGQGNNGGAGDPATNLGGGGGGAGAVGSGGSGTTGAGGIGLSSSFTKTAFAGTGNTSTSVNLTITAVSAGAATPGTQITGSGVPASNGIATQLTATNSATVTATFASTFVSLTSPVNTITLSSFTVGTINSVVVGQFVQPVTGIPVNTYVTAVNTGTNVITISNPITATVSGSASLFTAGKTGTYTLSLATTTTLTGTALTSTGNYYAGGGGGWTRNGTTTVGGLGGGAGGKTSGVGASGTPNTGGGGGGTGSNASGIGGNGGSGVLVIYYPNIYNSLASVGSGIVCNGVAGGTTPDITSLPGYKLYIFTAGTGNISW